MDGAAYIEVMIPNEESQPLPETTVDRSYKLRTPTTSAFALASLLLLVIVVCSRG